MFDDFLDDEDLQDDTDDGKPYVSVNTLHPPRENPELFGHADHESMLLSLHSKGTLPHALIFAGPKGVGKTTLAFRFARFLLSQKPSPRDGGEGLYIAPSDPVFAKVVSGGHADLLFIERPMDERKGVQKGIVDVDSIRKIPAFLRMTSSDGGWRIVIVDEADTMNRNAQNAILKILEEPPPKTLLILICNRLGAMVPTIRSRCRTFHFAPLPPDVMIALLKRAAPEASTQDLALLALLSDGSMGRAMTLHEEKGINTLNTILGLLADFPQWDWTRIHPMADNLSKPDSEKEYHNFAEIFEWVAQSFLRARAVGPQARPEILNKPELLALENRYSLEQWIEICEKLKAHFIAIDHSNLDKRQGVIGAFALLSE